MNALRSELMRMRSDLTLLGFLALALILSLTGSGDAVLIAALYAAYRYTNEIRTGVVARAVLFARRNSVLLARTVASALCGVLIGAVWTVGSLVVPWGNPDYATMLVGAPLGAMCGLFAGVVVRNYFAAPMLVATVYIGLVYTAAVRPGLEPVVPVLGVGVALVLGAAAWTAMARHDMRS